MGRKVFQSLSFQSCAVLPQTCPSPSSSPELNHLLSSVISSSCSCSSSIQLSCCSSSFCSSSCSSQPLLPCLQPFLLLLPQVGPNTVTILNNSLSENRKNVFLFKSRHFSKHRPSGPFLSISRNVCVCVFVCLSVCPSVHLWGTV